MKEKWLILNGKYFPVVHGDIINLKRSAEVFAVNIFALGRLFLREDVISLPQNNNLTIYRS